MKLPKFLRSKRLYLVKVSRAFVGIEYLLVRAHSVEDAYERVNHKSSNETTYIHSIEEEI